MENNEYDYNFEEEGIGLRGCFSLIIVLLLVLLLVAGAFWWWKNYFETDDLNKSKVLVEIDDEEVSIEGDADVELVCDADEDCVIEVSDKNNDNDEDGDDVIVKNTSSSSDKKDAKGKERDYSKLNKDLTEEYSTDLYEFKYAEGWRITKASAAFKVLTIDKDNAKLEIFKLEDFGGMRAFKFDGSESDSDLDLNVPKEVMKVEEDGEEYNLWLYYPVNDDEAKEALHDIVDTFSVN